MTTTLGPVIIIKRDAESTIDRGCRLYSSHWRPEIALIPRIAGATAHPKTTAVWLTEGYRNIRDTPDKHEELCAFDITWRLTDGALPTKAQYTDSKRMMSIFLGPDYDILVHGEGTALHIHCEYEGGR